MIGFLKVDIYGIPQGKAYLFKIKAMSVVKDYFCRITLGIIKHYRENSEQTQLIAKLPSVGNLWLISFVRNILWTRVPPNLFAR